MIYKYFTIVIEYLMILIVILRIKKMHRPGIGPGPPPWQGEILPLDQRCLYLTKITII